MENNDKMWENYIEKMYEIDQKASKLMKEWIEKHGINDRKALIDFANSLIMHYGEATGARACRMYDEIAKTHRVIIPAAEIANFPEYGEVAKAVNGALRRSPKLVPSVVSRIIKQIGEDAVLNNAKRDRAQFKWISSGDACDFCRTLASRDWQYVSENTLKNGHAEHIHANCKCHYAIRFDGKSAFVQTQNENSDKYTDVTRDFVNGKLVNDADAIEKDSVTVDGIEYLIDNINVFQSNSKREVEIAELLSKALGERVYLIPEVKGKYKSVKTPDFMVNDERWDLKELKKGTSKNLIRDIIHKKKNQSESFIFDITESKLPYEEIEHQAKRVFSNFNNDHAKIVMIVEDDEILLVLKRK